MQTAENIDELEALLADLTDSDLESLDDEVVAEKPAEQAKSRPAPVAEADDVDDALMAELEAELEEPEPEPQPVARKPRAKRKIPLEEPAEPVAEQPKVEEPVAEPEPEPESADEDAALDALMAAEEVQKTADSAPPAEEFGSDLSLFIDPDKLQRDLEFSNANIGMAMTRQAPLFAYYGTLAAKAQFQADRMKQQVDLLEAKLDEKVRSVFAASGTKATENMIKAAIIKQSAYQKAVERMYEAKAIAEMVKTAADSFRHRRDMLIQVGADLREEAKGRVEVKAHPGERAIEAMRGR